jgi:glycosyltransferase involved in cell wall biosynthesis
MLIIYLRLGGVKTGMKLINQAVIDRLYQLNVRPKVVPLSGSISFFRMFWDLIFNLDKSNRIYCNGSGSMHGLAFMNAYIFIANRKKIQVIFHSHNGNFGNYKVLRRLFFTQLQKGSSRFIVLSEIQREMIERSYHYTSDIINNCIRDEFFLRKTNVFKRNITEEITILCVSNFVRGKGQEELVEMIKSHSDSRVNLKLVGAIIDQDYFDGLRLTDYDFVRIYTDVQDVELLIELYDNSDFFWFPSNYFFESAPLVIGEAMSRGLKIISRDVGAISEMVEGGEYDIYNSEDEAVKILEKLKTSAKTRSVLNQQIAFQKFSSEKFHREIQNILL